MVAPPTLPGSYREPLTVWYTGTETPKALYCDDNGLLVSIAGGSVTLGSNDATHPLYVAPATSTTWDVSDRAGRVLGVVTAAAGASLATSAKQDTGNTSLASIDGKVPSKGNANMAGSSPVTIASNDTQFAALSSAISTLTDAVKDLTWSDADTAIDVSVSDKVFSGPPYPTGVHVAIPGVMKYDGWGDTGLIMDVGVGPVRIKDLTKIWAAPDTTATFSYAGYK